MIRFFSSLVILFLLSACGANSFFNFASAKKPISSNAASEKLNIALLIPMGAQKEQVSQYLIKSAELSIAENNNPNVNLSLFDSDMINSDPSLLLAKLQEQGVKAIIGPIYAAETDKLYSLLKKRNITILSLSNDSSLNKDSLLTLGVSPDSQTITIINYAISQGITNFKLLLPSTKYGKMIEERTASIVATKANSTQSTSWYSEYNAEQVINELVESMTKNPDNSNTAIFMPQGGKVLKVLNDALEKHILKVQLIGSQAWDNPSILRYDLFNGAILLKNDFYTSSFAKNYNKLFRTKPTNLDFITYSGIKLLSNMNKDDIFITKRTIVNNSQEFDDDSVIKFDSEGLILYKMPVMEIHNNQFKTMESYY
jgi:branched-chain amino acid transport system substrate-binding protein